MTRLPARLRAVLALVPPGSRVADIGSGHGMLATALAARGDVVIATERSHPAAELLRATLAVTAPHVEVRVGDGLAPLGRGEVDVAVIAGMGGRSIVAIMEGGGPVPPSVVLQPAQDNQLLERWIDARGLTATIGDSAERGRFYRAWRIAMPR